MAADVSRGFLDLVEAKFVDALRSVAAGMTLPDLQEKRSEFVKGVQEAVSGDLRHNGLELESASLTRLDQTSIEFFNPDNSFDAEGLTVLKKITEDTEAGGRTVRATPDEPQYLVRSDKSGGEAVHKPDALTRKR